MNYLNKDIIDKARIWVSNILDSQLPESCVFHNKKHTYDVLKNVEVIGDYYNLEGNDLNILRLCALFHDVGYIKTYADHENESAFQATQVLNQLHVEESSIKKITTAILATKVPQNPKDLFSEILCDADLMHLTYNNYFEQIELMREEWTLAGIRTFNQKEFHINSIQFFNSHHYHTEYGKLVLQAKKQKNLERIKRKIEDL
ncbi:MAG: HD domain-containing protein [Bacteroidetes bacterium]|nr:HD domain-containing protein [Bacteroidota bacterium]